LLGGFAAPEPDSKLSVPPDAANIPLPVISFIFEPEHIFLSNGGSYTEVTEKVRTMINEMLLRYNVIVSFIYAGGKGSVYLEPWSVGQLGIFSLHNYILHVGNPMFSTIQSSYLKSQVCSLWFSTMHLSWLNVELWIRTQHIFFM
jgi:hypothetical protein